MKTLDRIQETFSKGLEGISRKGVTWSGQGVNWIDSDAPGNQYSSWAYNGGTRGASIPGQHLNYQLLVGPLHHNSAYMACLTSIMDAFPEAPPCIKEKDAKGNLVVNPDHALQALIEGLGHADYDWTVLWKHTLCDYFTWGDAYWIPVYNRLGDPMELRFAPARSMKPIIPLNPTPSDPPVAYYEHTVGYHTYQVPVEEVIHFQYGADPDAPYLGMGRGLTLMRDIFQDNEGGFYSTSMLRSMGMAGKIITPKDAESAKKFNEMVVVDTLRAQTTGEKRGSSVAFNLPMDIFEPKNTPETMAIDKIRQYPESRVCAVMNVPQQVAGLLVGNTGKTYSNYPEARMAFWEDLLLPTQRDLSIQGTMQLIRRMREYKAPKVYFGFDDRNVRALAEDEHKKKATGIAVFESGLWDAARTLTYIGDEPLPADIGRMYVGLTPQTEGQVLRTVSTAKGLKQIEAGDEEDDLPRMNSWIDRIESDLRELEVAATSNGAH